MLKVEQLKVKEKSGRLLLQAVDIEIPRGYVLGLTGHSGSGKTTLLRSILGMLHGGCHIHSGSIRLDEQVLSQLSPGAHRSLCGTRLGFVPQNPMTAFDSRLKIRHQMLETFTRRLHIGKETALSLAREMLCSVNLKDTERILQAYPAELSGGMLQRTAVALTLGLSPDYILADEPTAALDEENRDILLSVLREMKKETGILFVSHDADALKTLCDEVCVLGEGQIIARGTMETLSSEPQSDWMKRFFELSCSDGTGDWIWESLSYRM